MQLVVNAGSSSLKWALFDGDRRVLEGNFDRLGAECVLVLGHRRELVDAQDHASALRYLVRILEHNHLLTSPITSVVHRVVHGGEKYRAPVVIDEQVLHDIEHLSVLAPLHNPANLAGINAAIESLPKAVQVAVFDTAFHQTIGREVFLYGLPLELYERFRIRKYGFHGISHSYVADRLTARYGGPVDAISCHLGSGSSITAIRHGRSADTTMGFTPLDGLIMGTRSGELDPEIPLFLIREGHYSPEQLEELFSKRSGLFGLTGHADMREVWAAAEGGDEAARLAIDMLAYRVAYYVNALRTASPDPKALVFTGGIGEGAWYVRKKVCALLGVPIDDAANRAHAPVISAADAPVEVLIIPADEQLQMHLLAAPLTQG